MGSCGFKAASPSRGSDPPTCWWTTQVKGVFRLKESECSRILLADSLLHQGTSSSPFPQIQNQKKKIKGAMG